MRKRYIVFVQDEWNNNYLMGVYNNLQDSLPEVNEFISNYNLHLDSLDEYACTFGPSFDQTLYTETDEVIRVRGFVWFDYELDKPNNIKPEDEELNYIQLSMFDDIEELHTKKL